MYFISNKEPFGIRSGFGGMAIVTSLFFCFFLSLLLSLLDKKAKQEEKKKTQESYNANDYLN